MASEIKVVTRREVFATIADRWKDQYYRPRDGWLDVMLPGGAAGIHARLAKIDPQTADRSEFDRAIGNRSWTDNECSNCQADVEVVVTFAGPEWADNGEIRLCQSCIAKASSLLEKEAVHVG